MSAFSWIENSLTPFMLEGGYARGRVVRLGHVAHTILTRYDYPAHVQRLLGELLAVAAMLSSGLKQEGIITLQIRGKGLLPLVVVDAAFGGSLRGYAELADGASSKIAAMGEYLPRALVGEGAYLAITLDPGEGMQRYQGIVALTGDSIAQALEHYFTHSQQIDAELKLAVSASAPFVAAGMMVERMPSTDANAEASEESWRYARAMMATLTHDEMLDPLLDAPALLYCLFHEQGVRVYDPQLFDMGCRCSRERIIGVLLSMSVADRIEMLVDGVASVHCQFCNKTEKFTPAEIGIGVG